MIISVSAVAGGGHEGKAKSTASRTSRVCRISGINLTGRTQTLHSLFEIDKFCTRTVWQPAADHGLNNGRGKVAVFTGIDLTMGMLNSMKGYVFSPATDADEPSVDGIAGRLKMICRNEAADRSGSLPQDSYGRPPEFDLKYDAVEILLKQKAFKITCD
ncbi:MAG: hypothetical protein HYZ71_09685 [Deltaproteobacteria bacterium]|nr:hypothetical protein [Deltaproteobacteria bacterium]